MPKLINTIIVTLAHHHPRQTDSYPYLCISHIQPAESARRIGGGVDFQFHTHTTTISRHDMAIYRYTLCAQNMKEESFTGKETKLILIIDINNFFFCYFFCFLLVFRSFGAPRPLLSLSLLCFVVAASLLVPSNILYNVFPNFFRFSFSYPYSPSLTRSLAHS